jgi:hypothetical protein
MQKSFSSIYYCGQCASYGHLPNVCSRRQIDDATVTEPLQAAPVSATKWIHLRKTDECVKTALSAAGEKPMICQTEGRLHRVDFKENTRRLKAVCRLHTIRWYDAEGVVLNFEPWSITTEYLKNPRGDVISKKGVWIGRWSNNIIDTHMPNPIDILPEEDCRA